MWWEILSVLAPVFCVALLGLIVLSCSTSPAVTEIHGLLSPACRSTARAPPWRWISHRPDMDSANPARLRLAICDHSHSGPDLLLALVPANLLLKGRNPNCYEAERNR